MNNQKESYFYVDGNKYQCNTNENVLYNCLSLGLNIPYFCWHPALGSIGSCRQCIIKEFKNKNDTNGNLIISCMTPAKNEMILSINDTEAISTRKKIIEMIMSNHPHDCPICPEGGQCHLQDMNIMLGNFKRKYRFKKRIYRNQNLGPFITHKMNRCITCYRCVRFYKSYAGGVDFNCFGNSNNIYFGRMNSGTLKNEFSGNLIEICPTGVFTDKTNISNFYRKWEIQFSPSICHQCSVGCNIIIGSKNKKVCRIDNRYNYDVNGYFICDLGRFGYKYINNIRPMYPMQKINSKLTKVDNNKILSAIIEILKNSNNVIGIGSPRASIESNFALKDLVGEENFFANISINEKKCTEIMANILTSRCADTLSIKEIEDCDAVLILGEDVTQTGSRIALAIRQAIKNKAYKISNQKQKIYKWQSEPISIIGQENKYPLFISSIYKTKLDDIATLTYYNTTDAQAKFGFSIADYIDNRQNLKYDIRTHITKKIKFIAETLMNAKRPLIVTGSHHNNENIIKSASNIVYALKNKNVNAKITFIFNDVNTLGLELIGCKSIDKIWNKLINGKVDTIITLESDLYRNFPEKQIDLILKKVKCAITIDHQYTKTAKRSTIILPTTTFAESSGTVVNNEGRMQNFYRAYNIDIPESWKWIYSIKDKINFHSEGMVLLNKIIKSISNRIHTLSGIYDMYNNNLQFIETKNKANNHFINGRSAILSNITVYEKQYNQYNNNCKNYSEYACKKQSINNKNISFIWHPGWNSVQAWNKLQKMIGKKLKYSDYYLKLFEHKTQKNSKWFKSNSYENSFNNKNGSLVVVPYLNLFYRDELTQYSDVIKKRISKISALISINDAKIYKIKCLEKVKILCDNNEIFILPINISHIIHDGQLCMPFGIIGISKHIFGKTVQLIKL